MNRVNIEALGKDRSTRYQRAANVNRLQRKTEWCVFGEANAVQVRTYTSLSACYAQAVDRKKTLLKNKWLLMIRSPTSSSVKQEAERTATAQKKYKTQKALEEFVCCMSTGRISRADT